MASQVEEELSKKDESETKKAPAQFFGKKTTAPVVNQISMYPYQQNPF